MWLICHRYLHLSHAIIHHSLLCGDLWHHVHQGGIKLLLFDMSWDRKEGSQWCFWKTNSCCVFCVLGNSGRHIPTFPLVCTLPRPCVWSFTVHTWNSCLKRADSAPSFTVSTFVVIGYFCVLMNSYKSQGQKNLLTCHFYLTLTEFEYKHRIYMKVCCTYQSSWHRSLSFSFVGFLPFPDKDLGPSLIQDVTVLNR